MPSPSALTLAAARILLGLASSGVALAASRTPEPQVPPDIVDAQGPGRFPNDSVTAANWLASTPPGADYESTALIVDLAENGPIPWCISRYNRGDFAVRLSPRDPAAARENLGTAQEWAGGDASSAPSQSWRTSSDVGVLLPSVRKNGQEWQDGAGPFFGTAAIGNNSSGPGYSMDDGTFGTGHFEVQIGRAGARTEANINFATAWFPYDEGWTAGFVGEQVLGSPATWRTPLSHSLSLCKVEEVVQWEREGVARVTLPGIHSVDAGMLFAVSAKGDSNVKVASALPLPDGSGWLVGVREDAESNTLAFASAGSDFAFVHVPYTAENLIGGHIDGNTAAAIRSAGTFTVSHQGTGIYRLVIPGKTGATGMLILVDAAGLPTGSIVPGDRFLSYEFDTAAGAFIVQAHHTTGDESVAAQDTDFCFAYIDFKQPPRWRPPARTGPAPQVPPDVADATPPGPFPNGSVSAANWSVSTPPGADYDTTSLIVDLAENGPIPWSLSRYNRGDLAVRLSPRDPVAARENLGTAQEWAGGDASSAPSQSWRTSANAGVLLPTVRRNGQAWEDGAGPFFGTAAIGNNSSGPGYSMDDGSFGTGDFELQTGRAGGRTEANIDFASGWFPFDGGWTAGFLAERPADGPAVYRTPRSFAGCGCAADLVTWERDGLASVTLPRVDSIEDGLLFVVSAKGDSNVKIAAAPPKADGSGWWVGIREDAEADPQVLVGPGSDFAILHVPYTAQNLVAGSIDGDNGSVLKSAGDFTVSRQGTGTYQVRIPGKTGATGMLILVNADTLASDPTLPDNNFLSYQYDAPAGAFVVQARHTTGDESTALEDTRFGFAYVDFARPLSRFGNVGSGTAPGLSIARTANGAISLSWPAAAAGFGLETAMALLPTGWSAVVQVPVTEGGTNRVEVTASGTAGFYRLRKP